MNKNQIYLHGENSPEPKLVELNENPSAEDILESYKSAFTGTDEAVFIFIEDEDQSYKKGDKGKIPVKKKGHVHCHRCGKINVIIFYNGDDKSLEFPPAITAKQILKKATKAFNIGDADAGDYLLKLEDKTILQPNDHIGSFASYPSCQVKLFLTPTKPVQG